VKAAGVIFRIGVVMLGMGLFALLLEPLSIFAALLWLPVATVVTLAGLCATNIRPGVLAIVGGTFVVLGVGWTVYYVRSYYLDSPSCPLCPPSYPSIDDPWLLIGMFTIACGVSVYLIAVLKWRKARGEHYSRSQLSKTTL
jgi:hypothetical protein